MKKVAFLVLVLVAWAAYVSRHRLFVRDPLGTVTRSGIREDRAQVFLNYDSDVLLENDRAPAYLLLVQHGQPVGAPAEMKCLQFLACLTSRYPAPLTSTLPGVLPEAMTSRQVQFRDDAGREVVAKLR